MPSNRTAYLIAVLALIAGCLDNSFAISPEAKNALEGADRLILFSLQPCLNTTPLANDFHSYEILGQTTIDDANTKEGIVEALLRGADESDGTVASCFEPRHGVRASHGGREFDFVICFECFQAEVFVDGRESGWFSTTDSPQPTLDGILRKAAIRLAPSAFETHE